MDDTSFELAIGEFRSAVNTYLVQRLEANELSKLTELDIISAKFTYFNNDSYYGTSFAMPEEIENSITNQHRDALITLWEDILHKY